MINNIVYYIFIFILVWWVVFFIILPFGVKVPDTQQDNAHASSAPVKPYILFKILITTVSSLIIVIIYSIIEFSS